MAKVFPKSANQPNKMALTICNSISRNCFRLMRDWKLESFAVPNGKSGVPLKVLHNFRMEFPENWLQTEISGFSCQMMLFPIEKWNSHRNFRTLFSTWKAPHVVPKKFMRPAREWMPRSRANFLSKVFSFLLKRDGCNFCASFAFLMWPRTKSKHGFIKLIQKGHQLPNANLLLLEKVSHYQSKSFGHCWPCRAGLRSIEVLL